MRKYSIYFDKYTLAQRNTVFSRKFLTFFARTSSRIWWNHWFCRSNGSNHTFGKLSSYVKLAFILFSKKSGNRSDILCLQFWHFLFSRIFQKNSSNRKGFRIAKKNSGNRSDIFVCYFYSSCLRKFVKSKGNTLQVFISLQIDSPFTLFARKLN